MPSSWNKRLIVNLLRQEIAALHQQGLRSFFRSGEICLAAHTQRKTTTCIGCALLDFVPAQAQSFPTPCHEIPLNEQGDTIDSLSQTADRATLKAEVLVWMERSLAQLEHELGADTVPPRTQSSSS